MNKQGIFYIVGVGPGDPELLTFKGARVLAKCPVWLVPKAHANGESTAFAIASQMVDTDEIEIVSHHFPMKHVHRGEKPDEELQKAWNMAAAQVIDILKSGRDVAFPTLGDPAIYSTAFYVCEALQQADVDVAVEVIPGVSAVGATAAVAKLPLCLGDEHLVVIPATFNDSRIREILAVCDSVAFMKVHRVFPKILQLLEEFNLVEKAVLIEKTSLDEQQVWKDLRAVGDHQLHYFSTLIIRK